MALWPPDDNIVQYCMLPWWPCDLWLTILYAILFFISLFPGILYVRGNAGRDFIIPVHERERYQVLPSVRKESRSANYRSLASDSFPYIPSTYLPSFSFSFPPSRDIPSSSFSFPYTLPQILPLQALLFPIHPSHRYFLFQLLFPSFHRFSLF